MKEEYCHKLVHQHSAFLTRIYKSNDLSVKKILSVAKDEELKTLIAVLTLNNLGFFLVGFLFSYSFFPHFVLTGLFSLFGVNSDNLRRSANPL